MIYLMRHGMDDESKIGGWSNSLLSIEGINQVKSTLEYLKNNNIKINQILCSDINRCKQTANIINKYYEVNIFYSSELRELDKGLLTGLYKNIAYEKFKDYKDLKDINKKYPEGESLVTFNERIKKIIPYILSLDNILIITHRGVINMFYYNLNNIELDYDKERFNVEYSSLHSLDKDKILIKRIY